LLCVDGAASAAVAGELAAMAAAAIASGAVALLEVGVAAGTSVGATVTGIATAIGIATATGFGVVGDAPLCCPELVVSVAEDDFSVDFAVPAFESLDLALDCWPALTLASALTAALEAGLAASEGGVLSRVVEGSSARRCEADCVCAAELLFPLSAAVLLSISAPKLVPPDDWSDRADLCGTPG
jgi:hypothetical protein